MYKRIAIVSGLVALTLSGCGAEAYDGGGDGPENTSDYMTVVNQKMPDGNYVTCVQFAAYQKGGISCDFEHPHSTPGGYSNPVNQDQ